jgi:hypothetical protein
MVSGLFHINGRPQPFPFQSVPDSFHCNGGVYPSHYLPRLPLLQSPLFPVVHPISLQPLTKCSSRNSFALTTIHFHGGCIPPPLQGAEEFVEFVGGVEVGFEFAGGEALPKVVETAGEEIERGGKNFAVGEDDVAPGGIGAAGEAQ